jgi:hypothetical protein
MYPTENNLAWIPNPYEHPAYLNSVRDCREVIGAVAWLKDQKVFTSEIYFLVSERVQRLISQARDLRTASMDLAGQMESVGLLENGPVSWQEAALVLVHQNQTLRDYVALLSVPRPLPKSLPPENPKARFLLNNINVEQCGTTLTTRPREPG